MITFSISSLKMATIDLNNLIRPKQVNSQSTNVNQRVSVINPVYVDLHLDFTIEKSIGIGLNAVQSKDILVDTNIEAVKNSIKNIFTTKKGEKVLNPSFGCSLEQFLFEPVTQLGGRAIGDTIYDGITQFEPRVEVIKVNVQTSPYSTPKVMMNGNFLSMVNSNQTEEEIGPGYGITVIYTLKEINRQDTLNIFAQLGGQILF